jgi:hypothetical protein
LVYIDAHRAVCVDGSIVCIAFQKIQIHSSGN